MLLQGRYICTKHAVLKWLQCDLAAWKTMRGAPWIAVRGWEAVHLKNKVAASNCNALLRLLELGNSMPVEDPSLYRRHHPGNKSL